MTTYTSPDNLPAPSAGAPADGPNNIDALADATQIALNKKLAIVPTSVSISRASGWANNFPTASKAGKIVILSSYFQRSATLAVVANTAYQIGTLPAGYRPTVNERVPCAWSDGGTRRNGQVWILMDGTIDWYPTVNATLAVDDFVSVSGVVYVVA